MLPFVERTGEMMNIDDTPPGVTYRERSLTIVLLDLVQSTKFVERVGAVRAARWLQRHDRMTRSLLYRFRGREIDRSDGFLFTFDHVIDGVNFALYYQAGVPLRTGLKARVGIHCGPVVEVQQDELSVLIGAKAVEVEGVTKNIAARTMSAADAGQILLTSSAFGVAQATLNNETPKLTRFACVGLYRFKGVKGEQLLYAVGQTLESLQPPRVTGGKVKKLAGPRKVKSRLKHKKLIEWLGSIYWALFVIAVCYLLALVWPWVSRELLWMR